MVAHRKKIQVNVALLNVVILLMLFAGHVGAASFNEYMESAKQYADKGNFRAAIIEYKNAVKADPKNAQTRYLLGEVYLGLGDAVSAEKEIRKAATLGLKSEEVMVALGAALLMQRKLKEIDSELKDNETFSPRARAELYDILGRSKILQGELEQADELLQKGIAIGPDAEFLKISQAKLFMVKNEADAAEKILDEVLAKEPASVQALVLKGDLARAGQRFDEAKELFKNALSVEKNNMAAMLGLISAEIALGNTSWAYGETSKILKLVPDHVGVNYLHAVASYRTQNVDEAEKVLTRILAKQSEHLPSLQLLGVIDYEKNKLEQAVQMLAKVVAANPRAFDATKVMASAYLSLQQPQKAIDALGVMLEENVQDAQLYSILGMAHVSLKNLEKGLGFMEKAASLAPNESDIRTRIAMVKLMAGEDEEAVLDLKNAADMEEELSRADLMLILTYLRTKKFELALARAEELKGKVKNDALAYNLIGLARLGMGELAAAKHQFKLALKENEKFLPSMLNLARIAEQAGELAEAKTLYQGMLKVDAGNQRALLALAKIAGAEGKGKELSEYVGVAKNKNPKSVAPGLFLVQHYVGKKEHDKALIEAKKLKVQFARNYQVQKALGMVYVAMGNYKDAVPEFKELVNIDSSTGEANYLLAKTYLQISDLDSAQDSLNRAIQNNKEHFPSYLSLAEVYVKRNQQSKALKLAGTLKKKYPESAMGYKLEGDIYLYGKNNAKAAISFKQAYELSNNEGLFFSYHNALKNVDAKKAIAELEEMVTKNNSQKALLLLGSEYQRIGKNNKAIGIYEKLLEANPSNVVILNNLAWLLYLEKNQRGLEYAKQAHELAPENPAIADTYGWILVNSGQASKALGLLRKAAEVAPEQLDIRYHLAYAYDKNGMTDKAKSELEQLIGLKTKFAELKSAVDLLREIKSRK